MEGSDLNSLKKKKMLALCICYFLLAVLINNTIFFSRESFDFKSLRANNI